MPLFPAMPMANVSRRDRPAWLWGGHATMVDPAALLAAHGFAVFVPHYFDRTGTTGVADKQTASPQLSGMG